MSNNISFNTILNQNKSTDYKSSITNNNSNSFGNLLSQNMSVNNDSILEGSSDNSSLFMGLLEGNSGIEDTISTFLNLLGLNSFSGQENNNMLTHFLVSLKNIKKSNTSLQGVKSFVNNNRPMINKLGKYNTNLPNIPGQSYGEDLTNRPVKSLTLSPGQSLYPPLLNNSSKRHPAIYREIIDQFDVESNPRYAPNRKGRGDTYCNIFTWDVTRAMGAEIPHYINPETNEPMYFPNVEGAVELSANRTHKWLQKVGQDYGWHEVSAEQAQALANQGRPAITVKEGHVQVVSPSHDGLYDPNRGVTIAQAGSRLVNYAPLNSLYRDFSDFKYYAHI